MRKTVNLCLFLIVLCLAGFTYQTHTRQTTAPAALMAIDINRVQNISITRRNVEPLEFQRAGNHWIMTRPLKTRPDPSRMQMLLQIANLPSRGVYEIAPHRLDEFGLATPAASIRFDEHTLLVGNAHPVKPLRYVWYRQSLHLLDDTFLQLGQAGAAAFLNHTPGKSGPPQDLVARRPNP